MALRKLIEPSSFFDLIIIGAGPGGYHAALRASQYGASVAIIEKDKIGGACTNLGCIPIICFEDSAKLLENINKKAQRFGVNVGTRIGVNFSRIVERKNSIVLETASGIEKLLKLAKVNLFKGCGRVEEGTSSDGFRVSCMDSEGGKVILTGKRIIIATGSIPEINPSFLVDHERILTTDDVLSPGFKTLPKSLVIIGSGVIGCEFALIFASFGVDVTVIEFQDKILAIEDDAVIKELKKKFDDVGIKVHTNQLFHKMEKTGTSIKVTTIPVAGPGDEFSTETKNVIETDMCLISIGRERQSMNLGLEELGIQIKIGQIIVNNDTCETSVKGIYAVGDVVNNLMLAQLAFYEGDIAVTNALTSIGNGKVKARSAEYFVIPYTIYTNPTIASVGMREKEAKKLYNVGIGRFFFKNLGIAKCMGDEEGFMMIVVNLDNDKILGASCIGSSATELISEVAVAIQHDITAKQLGAVIHSHPTFSEMVLEAVEDTHGKAIHKIGKRK